MIAFKTDSNWIYEDFIRLKRMDLIALNALKNAPETFYASDLEGVDQDRRGGVIGGWDMNGWIESTGNTREVWFNINEDTMKRGVAKEWRKVPGAQEKLETIIPLLTKIYETLTV